MRRDLICIPKPVRAHLSDGVNDYRLISIIPCMVLGWKLGVCTVTLSCAIPQFIIMSGCEPVHNERPTGMRAMLGLWKTICLL